MGNQYGVRFVDLDTFVKYCEVLNIETEKNELEYYEGAGLMLPIARVIYPDALVKLIAGQEFAVDPKPVNTSQWPDFERLFEKERHTPKDFASITDNELIDSFDRETGQNPLLSIPSPGSFRSWDTYSVKVPGYQGHLVSRATATHYYGYWQVHQLYLLKKFPDLYENKILLAKITEEIKQKLHLPRAYNADQYLNFKNLAKFFDALSFWIILRGREHQRTFALVPEEHQVQHLDSAQSTAYRARLLTDAKLVQSRFGLNEDILYGFLNSLIDLRNEYEKLERFKLAEELRSDIIHLSQFISILSIAEIENVAEELGKRHGIHAKQDLRHTYIHIEERDDARSVLKHQMAQYISGVKPLGFGATWNVTESDIDTLLDYCQEKLPVLITALGGMIATEAEYNHKFRRVSRYSNLKNLLTSIEYLLKNFALSSKIVLSKRDTFIPIVDKTMCNEAWLIDFRRKITQYGAEGSLQNILRIKTDPDLIKNENSYLARAFLLSCVARNLTVHNFPDQDWFYGEYFGEMLNASVWALMYCWQVGKREGWA